MNVVEKLYSAYRLKIAVVNVIINSIRFCSCFELTLRRHHKMFESSNLGISRGLIGVNAELDTFKKSFAVRYCP